MERWNLKLSIQPDAQADIEEIWMAYAELSGFQSANRVVDRIYKAIDQLLLFPLSGANFHDGPLKEVEHRYILAGKHLVIYHFSEETVTIYRVVHGAADYPRLFKNLQLDDEQR